MQLPVDLGAVLLDGRLHWFVAHLVSRHGWWRGRVVAAMNAQYLGRWDVAPRGHPNDGRLDVLDADLPFDERLQVRARLKAGTHVPHPRIDERHVTAAPAGPGSTDPRLPRRGGGRRRHAALAPRRARRPRLRGLRLRYPQVGSRGGSGQPEGPPQGRGGGTGRATSSRPRTRSTSTRRRTTRSTSPTTSSRGLLEAEGLRGRAGRVRRRHRLRRPGPATAGPTIAVLLRVRRAARHRPRLRPQHHRHRRPRRRPGRRRPGRGGRRARGASSARRPRRAAAARSSWPAQGAFDGIDAAMMVHPAGDDLARMDVIAVQELDRHLHRARRPTRPPSPTAAATPSTPPCSAT